VHEAKQDKMDASCILQALSDVSSELNIQLKDQQAEAIVKFCQGHDVFVLLLTSFGKSMIYGLLPLLFDKMRGKSSCFIIAMLFTLMNNRSTRKHCCLREPIDCNYERPNSKTAEFVREVQTDPRIKLRVLRGNVQLLFISPENLLCNVAYWNMILTEQYKKSLVCVAVDEAHCVKTW